MYLISEMVVRSRVYSPNPERLRIELEVNAKKKKKGIIYAK